MIVILINEIKLRIQKCTYILWTVIFIENAKTIQWGKKKSFQQMLLGQLDIHMQRKKLDPYLTPCTYFNSKQIIDLNVRSKMIKLLEKNIGVNLGLGSILDPTPKLQITKEKIDKLDLIKTINFCDSKDTIKKVKRQLTKWEKIFAHHKEGVPSPQAVDKYQSMDC